MQQQHPKPRTIAITHPGLVRAEAAATRTFSWNGALKRTMDVCAAALLLIILSPIFAWVCYRVRQTGKSMVFGHTRIGRDGVPFQCYKFRTMVENAGEVLHELLANDPEASKEWYTTFKLKNDPRVTQIGHFLRRTSLDELPQLWNVLNGTMSLVGPRPIVAEELIYYREHARTYKSVLPGMTGLWQVSGRSDTSYEYRVKLDTEYVAQHSVWMDIGILLRTVKVVLRGDGAY